MTIPVELLEPDAWPRIRQKIAERRVELLEGLLTCEDLGSLKKVQGAVAELDWVIEQAKPKPDEPEPIYED